jgi:formylglycine-generating enzyme required for sulfatase activity/serine/threonine protein kinase
MGTVFLAEDTQLQRQVALKIPQFESDNDHELLERFYREARAAATLNHPNLCPVHDVGEIDGIHYLTMAFIEGKELADLVRPGEPLSAEAAATIVHKVALGMAEAHDKGIVHRDLKPANISMNHRGDPVVMDFGLARLTDRGETRLTQSGAVIGTPAYMAPEQIKGEIDAIGPGCDIYSLGVILFELMTGEIPFDGPIAAVLGQVLTQEPPPPSKFCPGLDLRLEAICLMMMSKQREDRYDSMYAVADALGAFLFETTRSGAFLPSSGPQKIAADASGTYKISSSDEETRRGPRKRVPMSERMSAASGVVQQSVGTVRDWAGPRKKPLGIAIGAAVLFLVACMLAFQFFGDADDGSNQPGSTDEVIVDSSPGRRSPESDDTNGGDTIGSGTNGSGTNGGGTNGGGTNGSGANTGVTTRPNDNSGRGNGASNGRLKEITNGIGMRLVLLPAGDFSMGESASQYAFDDERPRHRVSITTPIYIGKYEVTQKEYVAVMGTNPSFFRSDNRPVESVSWNDAREFCRKLGVQENVVYRLPTEAEWEYACRAGSTTSWHFGNDASRLRDYAWSFDIAGGSTSEVGRLKSNDFGLFDIHGNVSEWCSDWYSFNYYSESPVADPQGPNQNDAARLGYTKVVRGGSWDSTAATCRSAYRGTSSMMVRTSRTGFRVVRVDGN